MTITKEDVKQYGIKTMITPEALDNPILEADAEWYIERLLHLGWAIVEIGKNWYCYVTARYDALTPSAVKYTDGYLLINVVFDENGPLFLAIDSYRRQGDHPIRELKLVRNEVDCTLADRNALKAELFDRDRGILTNQKTKKAEVL